MCMKAGVSILEGEGTLIYQHIPKKTKLFTSLNKVNNNNILNTIRLTYLIINMIVNSVHNEALHLMEPKQTLM